MFIEGALQAEEYAKKNSEAGDESDLNPPKKIARHGSAHSSMGRLGPRPLDSLTGQLDLLREFQKNEADSP